MIKVTVIIPAYNAQAFIKDAIYSALYLQECGEIIVIDDGSQDDTLNIVQEIESRESKVKLYHHEGNHNKGVSASRNLGIKLAKFEFISFLDADDKYQPYRFEGSERKFSDQSIDGVYGATQAFYETDTAKEMFLERYKVEVTRINVDTPPDNIFKALLWQDRGLFHISSITLRKRVFKKVGCFDVNLSLGEDTELWYRISATCNLIDCGLKQPISLRRVHADNHIHSSQERYDLQMHAYFKNLAKWIYTNPDVSYDKKNDFFLATNAYKRLFSDVFSAHVYLFKSVSIVPQMLLTNFFWRKLFQILKAKWNL